MKRRSIGTYFKEFFHIERRSAIADSIVPGTIGLGVGMLAGTGLGMLFAPRSGAELRQQLAARAEQLKDRARLGAEKAKLELSSAVRQREGQPSSFSNEVGQVR